MVEISQDAQAVLAKAGQGAEQFVISQGGFGDRLTSGEATRLLSGFKADAGNVFSTGNVANASGNPTPAPDDLLGIRSNINDQLGIGGLQADFLAKQKGLSEFDQPAETFQNTLEARPESINLIRGRQAEAGRLSAQERSGLAREAEIAQSALLAAKQEASDQFAIREADVRDRRQLILSNPGAGITFSDSPSQAANKMNKFRVEQEDIARKQAKKDAFDALYMNTFGTERGKLSRKEARKKLEKEFGSARAFEDRMKNLEETKLRKSIANIGASSGNNELTQAQIEKLNNASFTDDIANTYRGPDGYADTNSLKKLRDDYVDLGGTSTEFRNLIHRAEKAFGTDTVLLNPKDDF